jgi:hypothetical protein
VQDGWLAVPTIGKRVAIGLSSPGVPGWHAVQQALSLPELRAFAETAAGLAFDVTAPAAEWTSTCVMRHVSGDDEAPIDQIIHSPHLELDNGVWSLKGSNSVSIRTVLPPSGWILSRGNMPWFDQKTGLPFETTELLHKDPDALAATGYSYFWVPDHIEGITVVIRECERLRDQVMDICAAMDPGHFHPDIRLRQWRPL